jgi:cystathionine beta-lyase
MYNFDKIADRKNVYSLKWEDENVLPMWVADMDFDTMPEIKLAIMDRCEKGAFGYTNTPAEFFEAFVDFWKRRHHVDLDKNWMIFSTGVVPAISSIVRKMTEVGDRILLMTPTYNIFYNSILNNHRSVAETELVYDGSEYKLDWKDFEARIKNNVKMLILCNPQNPVGKIWTRGELQRIAKICKENNVLILSDEIHCDIVSPGFEYIPLLSIEDAKDISICTISPSKCFNLAGLQGACVVIPNEEIRKLVDRGLNTDEVAEGNVFVYDAFITALNKGDNWLNEMNRYIYENKRYLKTFLMVNLKDLNYHYSDATYLAWIDISKITNDSVKLCKYLYDNFKVHFQYGKIYGKGFDSFIRINLATSLENVKEGLNRLLLGINKYKEENNL